MTDIETKYRRFQDFGLVASGSIVVTLIGCGLMYASGGSPSVTVGIRTVFYLVLVWNLFGLRHCLQRESPVPGHQDRTTKGIVAATMIVILITLLGILCFEALQF